MNILASDVKSALKKIGSAKSETLFVDTLAGRLVSHDAEIAVIVTSDKLKDPEFGEVFCINARKFTTVVNRMSGTVSLTGGKSLKLESAKAKVELELLSNRLPPMSPPKETLKLPLQTVKALLDIKTVVARRIIIPCQIYLGGRNESGDEICGRNG